MALMIALMLCSAAVSGDVILSVAAEVELAAIAAARTAPLSMLGLLETA